MCGPLFQITRVLFSLVFATSLLSPESLAQASRLQHSVYFCGIQVRANSQNEQKVWSEAENGERDWDLRYTKLFCSLHESQGTGPVQTPNFSLAEPNTLN